MKSIRIDSAEELLSRLNSFPNNFIYRGHSSSNWKLESTLERILGKRWGAANARMFEERSLKLFQSKYHLYNQYEHVPKTKLAWLSVMQHYGVPTRLLDFTESPYMALFFALESYNPFSSGDLAIYAIDYAALMDQSLGYIKRMDSKFCETRQSTQNKQDEVFDEIVDRFNYNIIWNTEPFELNARIDRQLGSFLVCGNLEEKLEDAIRQEIYQSCDMAKLIIAGALYENVYALLRKMGISAKSIYGDLAGLAKSIRMEMLVYAVP